MRSARCLLLVASARTHGVPPLRHRHAAPLTLPSSPPFPLPYACAFAFATSITHDPRSRAGWVAPRNVARDAHGLQKVDDFFDLAVPGAWLRRDAMRCAAMRRGMSHARLAHSLARLFPSLTPTRVPTPCQIGVLDLNVLSNANSLFLSK